MTPQRITLSRKKGWRLPPNTVVVSRPSRYGNPHPIGFCTICGVEHTRGEALDEFEAEVREMLPSDFDPLRGKNLACWCKAGQRCHADILLREANK